MGGLVAIWKAILEAPAAAWRLLLLLWAMVLALLHREPHPPGRVDKAAKTHCVPIRDPAMVTPDPLVYSQFDLLARGIAVTWDNPDFGIFREGKKVDAHELQPDTEYVVVVRVWNASTDCPVVKMPVRLSYLEFGIGTVAHPVATRMIDVGVKGASNNPSFAQFAWRTPATQGHYCLQAPLDPASDLNYANNLGQHNTDVVDAHSPASFSFPLRNDTGLLHRYRFEFDSYAVAPRPCPVGLDWAKVHLAVPRRHDHPVPPGWMVDVAPSYVTLAPGGIVVVQVTVTPPPDFGGSQVINVHGYYDENHGERAAGGLSILVRAS